ncbi:hypothetical protein WJX77_003405 [Trebouxia sp. C0004]
MDSNNAPAYFLKAGFSPSMMSLAALPTPVEELIQPSRRAYSSPVIFLSRPDGSLRMCSQESAQIFLHKIFAKHGLPTEVITDRVNLPSTMHGINQQEAQHSS